MTTRTPGQTKIFYPETDGMPLPDGEFQGPMFREIVTTLETRFKGPNTGVNGNTFIYYEEGNPQRRIAPDCYIAFNISRESIERNNTYLMWEVGKPPDFALEIASPSTARIDLVSKRELYARLGIGEYWRYDKTGGDFYREPLVGEYLIDGEYRRFELHHEPDGMVWAHSPALNLDFCWDDGRLHIWDPVAGHWLLNHDEEHTARLTSEAGRREAEIVAREAQSAAREAEAARQTAEQRRQAAEERAERLEAELRRLRGDQP